MKIVSLLLFSSFCWAQIQNGSATVNGVSIHYEARLEKPTPPITNTGGGVWITENVIKRHLCDMFQGTYFGYDLTMAPDPA